MEKNKPNYRKIGIITVVLVLIGLAWLVYANSAKILTVLTPFIMGLVIAYLLNPLVKMLEARKVPRGIAIALIGLVFLIIISVLLSLFIPLLYSNIVDLISNIPGYTKYYENVASWLQTKVNYSNMPVQVKDIIVSETKNSLAYIEGILLAVLKNSLSAANGIFSFFLNLLLAVFLAYYFLKDLDLFKMQIEKLIPRKWRGGVGVTAGEINVIISKYIQGQLVIVAIVAVMETIGLALCGVKYFVILGLIGGLANLIPYFGPFIGAAPAVAIAFLDSPTKALFALLVFVIVQQIDNSIISPKIMSDSIGLHPVTIIFAILFFGTFFGIWGLLIAIPITAIIKVIGKKVIEKIV